MTFHDRESAHRYFSSEVGGKDKWSAVGVGDMMKSKHGQPIRESLHGSRVGEKDDNNDFVKNCNTATPWDRDETYSKKMSPGLDDWRLKKRHSSPKGDWNRSRRSSRSWSRSRSRSRSRSPVRDIKWQPGFHERTRNRSGVSTQLCKDFMAGRGRRGSQCHFLHQDIQNREDGWDNRQNRAGASKYITHDDGKDYPIKSGRSTDCCTDYLKGNCRRGASCRFAHDGATDGFSRRQTNEISSESEHVKRNRVRTPERDGEREARRTSDIPCKYFAAGNCHNGKYCRFSHHGQSRASPERSRGDRGVWGPSSVSVDKLHDGATLRDADEDEIPWIGPKWSDLDASNDVNSSWTCSKQSDANDRNNSWTGSKWIDAGAYIGATKLSKDTVENQGASESRYSNWPMHETRQHNYDLGGKNIEGNVQHKTVDICKEEVFPRKIEHAGDNMHVSEPKGAEESLGDMEMSPEWNYRIQSSVEKEHSYSSKSTLVETLLPKEKNITKEAIGQVHDGFAALQPTLTEKSSIHQDHVRGSSAVALPSVSSALSANSNSHINLNLSTNVLPLPIFDQPAPSPSSVPYSNLNAIGNNQLLIPSNEVNMKGTQQSLLFQEEKARNKLNAGDANILHGNFGSQTMAFNEQITQFTNLSASLAQLFGKGQQLPLLQVALNSHDGMQVNSFVNSGGHVEPDSVPTVQPDQNILFSKQYDPISDGIEPAKKQGTDAKPLGFTVHPGAEKKTADGQTELSASKLLTSSLLGNSGNDYRNKNSSKREPDLDSHKPNQLEPVASSEGKKENGGVEETKKAEGENGPSENIDADEGKKKKDDKGIRAFKFALAEFVKDLLKPTWKEGHIDKEAYKNIVKKVVDKVIATVQGTSIPQTREKIDQYLSVSKLKLGKLVQAYVEKVSEKMKETGDHSIFS
ncbi:Basic helix-loop-helix DNA-binding superfamily protein [Hibiscus syriacus]|uniref:Basic helix-loop-helix DNA-binding superfamily protein n=1 Tax=Hibiscus syriacus TaxID=106335 RepID=A0A6A3BT50_HIBSY|nr:Basic helix-loop-helix DNA-binding superfamily protein [Hibiscus syriacus]